MRLMKKIAAFGLSAVMLMGIAGCGNDNAPAGNDEQQAAGNKEVTVVLDWTPNTNHTGMYVAQDKGYYEKEGLNVSIVQPPEDGALALVASGKAQFAVDFQESLAAALTADAPLPVTAVAAIVDHNTSGIVSMKDKGIDSFKNMEGKKYATWNTPVEQAIIRQVMEAQGGDFDKVEKIPSTVTDAASAIQTNIDAVWVYEGWDLVAIQLAGLDYNFIKFSDVEPVLDFYTPVLVANNDFLQNDPETAKKFMAATAKGYEFAIANPEEAAEILVAAVPELSGDMIQTSQNFLAGEYKAEKPNWGTIDPERWTAFYDWMFEKGLIPTALGSKGFTNEYLPQ